MSCLLDASGSKAKKLLERGGFEGVEESLYIYIYNLAITFAGASFNLF